MDPPRKINKRYSCSLTRFTYRVLTQCLNRAGIRSRPGGFPSPPGRGFPRQGFCKKHAKTAIFMRFSAKNMQKQQYLQGFLQRACKNSNIYKVCCNKHSKTPISIRFSATHMQKQQYLWGSSGLRSPVLLASELRNLKFEIWNLKPEIWNLKSEIWNVKSEISNLKPQISNLKSEILFLKSEIWNLKSEIWNPKSEISNLKSKIWNLKSKIWNL